MAELPKEAIPQLTRYACNWGVTSEEPDGRYVLASEAEAALVAREQQWRCFHCDEVFTDNAEAREHFGTEHINSGFPPPACAVTIADFRTLEADNAQLRLDNDRLDNDARLWYESEADRVRRIGHVQWWQEMDSREGEKLMLQERVAALEAQLAASGVPRNDAADVCECGHRRSGHRGNFGGCNTSGCPCEYRGFTASGVPREQEENESHESRSPDGDGQGHKPATGRNGLVGEPSLSDIPSSRGGVDRGQREAGSEPADSHHNLAAGVPREAPPPADDEDDEDKTHWHQTHHIGTLGCHACGCGGLHPAARERCTASAALASSSVAVPKLHRFDCKECGHGIAVDEDGCCRTCGADAVAVPPAEQEK